MSIWIKVGIDVPKHRVELVGMADTYKELENRKSSLPESRSFEFTKLIACREFRLWLTSLGLSKQEQAEITAQISSAMKRKESTK